MLHHKIFPALVRVFAILAIIVFFTPLRSISQDKVKNVVILFSYGPNLPVFEKILTGMNSSIRGSAGEAVNIMTEYLDLSRSVNDDYSKFIINMYNEKLGELKVDLLITVGPGVNNALLRYGSNALKSLDIINVDLDMPGRTSLQDLDVKKGKEILLKFQPGNTMKHAFDLFPNRKNVFVISGVSKVDSFYTSLVRRSENTFEPDYHFHFISGLTLDSTIRFIRTIPKNSILFVPAYLQDAAKVSFSTPEALELISKNSPAPVFLSITDGGFNAHGEGIGGYLFSYINLGKEVGKIAHDVLDGKQVQQTTVNENIFYEYMYDWNELKRWGLTDSKVIPEGSVFYNKPSSFLQLYKWYIVGVLLFILSQTLLIIYLFRLNKRQKMMTAKMQVTESMHRQLIHSDRLSKMSVLTASLAHELFQPLAGIRLTAQAGKQFIRNNKLDDAKASQMFEHIMEDESRATKIIRSVKDLMKANTTDKEYLNLNMLILETTDLIRAEADKDGIRIEIISEYDPVIVLGDKIQLQQVLMNFIRNATAAMEKNDAGSKSIQIKLSVSGDNVTVAVLDSGPGLDPLVKEKLFMPFVSTKKEGFGIGLTLCKSLIEKHDGKIWAESIPGTGALFAFSIKLINR